MPDDPHGRIYEIEFHIEPASDQVVAAVYRNHDALFSGNGHTHLLVVTAAGINPGEAQRGIRASLENLGVVPIAVRRCEVIPDDALATAWGKEALAAADQDAEKAQAVVATLAHIAGETGPLSRLAMSKIAQRIQ